MTLVSELNIPAWTSYNERALLSSLAKQVLEGGLIVEIGCLYGGTTAVLALSNPKVTVISIDNFSWTPEGYPLASKQLFIENMQSVEAFNVIPIEGDSLELHKTWNKQIDLLWIDGGHSFEFVSSDLNNFSKFAKVIALHDYNNPGWPTIKKAVDVFLKENKKWFLADTLDMICVLRRLEG